MTPGDPCRVCDGPKPVPLRLAALPSNVPVLQPDLLRARWRATIGGKRDWICAECQIRAARYAGLVA